MDEGFLGNIVSGLIQRDGEGWGNGGGWWIFLILILFMGGGLWGGNARGNCATTQDVAVSQMFGQIDNGIRGLSAGQATANYENLAQFNNSNMMMSGGFANIAQAINDNGFKTQSCCCETNRNIDSVKYEMSQDTCRITSNATENTQKILDKLCQMESNAKDNVIAQLRTDLQAAQLTLGNAAQTQNIVSALKPSPVPAYVVSSPYASWGYNGTTFA